MEKEYHGDANSEEGRALAYRSYGTDLDDKLATLGLHGRLHEGRLPGAGHPKHGALLLPAADLAGLRPGAPGSRRDVRRLLLAVTAVSLVPRLWLATHRTLSHNGAWHLFAARFFRQELGTIAHPPLFLLLLKACDLVSRSLLSYRFVPLAAGAGSVYLVGRLLDRLGCHPRRRARSARSRSPSRRPPSRSPVRSRGTRSPCSSCSRLSSSRSISSAWTRSRRAAAGSGSRSSRPSRLLTEYLSGLFLIACVARAVSRGGPPARLPAAPRRRAAPAIRRRRPDASASGARRGGRSSDFSRAAGSGCSAGLRAAFPVSTSVPAPRAPRPSWPEASPRR